MPSSLIHAPDDYLLFENDRGEMILVCDIYPGMPSEPAILVLEDASAELRFTDRTALRLEALHPASREALLRAGAVVVVEMKGDAPGHVYRAQVRAAPPTV